MAQSILSEVSAEDSSKESAPETEEKEIYIQEITEEYEKSDGFLTIFRDNETNKVFLEINHAQLGLSLIHI